MKLKRKIKVSSLFICLIFFVSLTAACQDKSNLKIKAGYYEGMLDLAFDEKNKIIYGVISISSPDKSNRVYCSLMFKSDSTRNPLGTNRYSISFFTQEDSIPTGYGYIEIKNDGVNVKCYEFLSACQSLIDLKSESGYYFSLSATKPFKGVSKIKSTKAYIYNTATDVAKSKMYLVKNDFISILSKSNGWVLFEYMNFNGKHIKGWLKSEDILL
jgi:hypothetical protein